ncbi:MAG: DUF3473 domain-containing protein [candidate division Zixibacteria bacterium]|nr:DUF3473 domain-containing protein [candidate division Zixibacteria bacterium]
MENILSIDVEDWFHLMEHPSLPGPSEWGKLPSRVEANFADLLGILHDHNITGTCFFLGWIARKFPHLVKMASKAGFEIASHGMYHRPVYKQLPSEFLDDVATSRKICEDIIGIAVTGYRAPAFSITERTPWAFEKLIEAGYGFDTSIFPAKRDYGGFYVETLSPFIQQTKSGSIMEFPISITKILNRPFCFFGGGYFRLFPYPLIRKMALKVLNENRPLIFYIHPRDIDPEQPRYNLGTFRNFKSYVNLKSTERKLRRFLNDFRFTSYREWYKNNKERFINDEERSESR